MSNKEIAQLLREVAAAYIVKRENRFKVIAYDKAADSIEQFPVVLQSLWKQNKLHTVPGVGSAIVQHLDELFRTGNVKHFKHIMRNLPAGMFVLLRVPEFGPKRAFTLAKEFGLTHKEGTIEKLIKAGKAGKIAKLAGFGEKSQEELLTNLQNYQKGKFRKEADRALLHQADAVASEVLAWLRTHPDVVKATVLGSLRRRNSTIGDVDIAAATDKPEEVIKHFLKFAQERKVIEHGEAKAAIELSNGRQVDLRVQTPDKYGSMLQYFTGSKAHNIKLRELALKQHKSLSEYGIKSQHKDVWSNPKPYATEAALYQELGLPIIPPEIREDRGEIEAALQQVDGKQPGLPQLIEITDIHGDLHIHSDYDLQSSHDVGVDSIETILEKVKQLGYQYIGISDHNPKRKDLKEKEVITILKKRKEYFEQYKYSSKKSRVHILLMLEVDILPNGDIALPQDGFEYLDAAIVSLHSSFQQSRDAITKRILHALKHPKAKILGHPTGRLIGKREGVQADWDAVFDYCVHHNKALEINANPQRLDLPDVLVQQAADRGVKFVINTDSHDAANLDLMHYGIDVARRGWLEKADVLNTMGYNEFATWLRG